MKLEPQQNRQKSFKNAFKGIQNNKTWLNNCRSPLVFCKAVYWFALAVFAVKFNCVLLISQGLLRRCLASKFHNLS